MAAEFVGGVFGKRAQSHTLIIASGNSIRHWSFRPWLFGLAASVLFVVIIGYLLATSYLVLRDDLISASIARQARMQHAYEDRISDLRVQVDRITSRQLLDQEVIEQRVASLIEQQKLLSSRNGRIDSLLQDATDAVPISGAIPVPRQRPVANNAETDEREAFYLRGIMTDIPSLSLTSAGSSTVKSIQTVETVQTVDATHQVFDNVRLALDSMEQDQIDRIGTMAADANGRADAILSIIGESNLASSNTEVAIGGPYIEAGPDKRDFETSLLVLESALDRLQMASGHARQLPFGNPAPSRPITSGFGKRRDPFVGKLAFHAGIDFKTNRGYPVRVTAPGTVSGTGRKGGYGKMVEVDHGNGIVTRYAHLSRIAVEVGQKVNKGTVLGAAGSTGRSTGPHLHYEVRAGGSPINPAPLIHAGQRLEGLVHY